jgi:AcrR family transcriptional regulator
MAEQSNTKRFAKKAASEAKRLRTRALLMDAAVTVFARRGVEAAAVSEIATEAAVAIGTFYYHFSDKSELVDIVGHEVAAQLVAEVDEVMASIDNGTKRVALGTQCFLRFASADPEWGHLVVNALTDMRDFRDRISAGIRKDVAIGVKQMGFEVPVNELLFTSVLAVVATGLRAILSGEKARPTEMQTAAMVLQLLGMTVRKAHDLVSAVSPLLSQIALRPKAAEERARATPEKRRAIS